MNETDVKDLFASVAAHPAADRINLDAVLTGGRRRHRTRVAAILGASLGALAVIGALMLSALPGTSPTPVGPTPTTATGTGQRVTGADQILGQWRLLEVGSGAGTIDPKSYPESRVTFTRNGIWAMGGGGCNPPMGTFTITSKGRFAANADGAINMMACAQLRPDVSQAASLIIRTSERNRTLTMLLASGEVLATWTAVLTDSTPQTPGQVLDVSCSPEGIAVSSRSIAAQDSGVVLRVSSTLPQGSYLAYGYGGDKLPASTALWTLRTPPGPLTLSCRPGGADSGARDETTVTVKDTGWWDPTTLDQLGCTMGGIPSWAIQAPEAAASPQEAIDALLAAFPADAPLTARRALAGYPGYWPQTWIASKDGTPSFTITLSKSGDEYRAYPDYLCAAQ